MEKKQKTQVVQNDSDVDAVDDAVSYASDVPDDVVIDGELNPQELGLLDDQETDDTPCNTMSAKARERLNTKKRLDVYLEKQRLKELGWDEDDELFDDDFFSETKTVLSSTR